MSEIQKMDLRSEDLVVDRIERMRELFPEVFGESGIDFDKLRLELGDEVDNGNERYAFTWPGKKDAIRHSQTASAATLRPCVEKSRGRDGGDDDFDSGNIYIEGDNLEALKLLQRGYHGKVKLIYIDPPYNTGKDFVYHDCFVNTIENYKQQACLTGQSNAETNGRFHSDWCSMMYPRLKLARELLSDDGAIFISIDDNENHNLKAICDEIFGSYNYQATICIQVRYGNKSLAEAKAFKPVIEYILVYSKNASFYTPKQPLAEYDLSKFCFNIEELNPGESFYVDEQRVEVFKSGNWSLTKQEQGSLSGLKETWITGSIYTNMSYGKVFQKVIEPRVQRDGLGCLYKVYGRGDDGLGYRYYTGPARAGSSKGKMFSGVPLQRVEEIASGKQSLKKEPIVCFGDYSADFGNIRTEGGVAFNSGKKPIKLLEKILDLCSDENALVMDFFSGSASFAHAVMEYNLNNDANFSYILVQLPEIASDGFDTICELGEERIRRSGKTIVETVEKTNRQLKLGEEPKRLPDIGFRVFALDDSGIQKPEPGQLLVDCVKPDRSDLDIVFEMMLKWGLELTLPVEREELAGYPCYTVAYGELVCCLAPGLTIDALEAIAEIEPRRVFILDSILDDSLKLNAVQIFKRVEERTGREVELRTV